MDNCPICGSNNVGNTEKGFECYNCGAMFNFNGEVESFDVGCSAVKNEQGAEKSRDFKYN